MFFLINLLGTPAFYTQQLFVVYILVLGLIAIGYFLCNFSIQKNAHYVLRSTFHVFIAFLIIGLINSFWLLPQIYFLKTNSRVVFQSKQIQLATEDTYYQNKEKGTIKNFLKLEGFYYDLLDKNNQPLFKKWHDHFQKFSFLQYFFVILMILGIIDSIRKRNFVFLPLLIFLSIVFLNNTFPFDLIDSTFRQFRFYNQIFRSPFTKFIIPYSLVYSYFVAKSIEFFHTFEIKKNIVLRSMFHVLLLIAVIFYSFPSFQGYFFSPKMKVKIPAEYLNLIDYFKKEDKNKRIALLPEYTFWGWYQYRWGYNGSGFLWYGIEQPIVSRTFDT